MSEDLFYERNDNISGVSVIGPFDFTPSYGSSVSFQSDNLRFDTNDGYFKIIPNGINNLKAKFNLKYQTDQEGAKKLTKYYENSKGIDPIVIRTDNSIYKDITGYCTEYAINHINNQSYEFNAMLEVLESPGNLNWTGLNYLNNDFERWDESISYKKDDVVFYDFDQASDFMKNNPTQKDLVAYWALGQAGTTPRVSSVGNFPLATVNSIPNTYGVHGYADYFDNPVTLTDDNTAGKYLTRNQDDPELSITGAQTWSAWILVQDFSVGNLSMNTIMSKYEVGGSQRSLFLGYNGGNKKFRVIYSSDGGYINNNGQSLYSNKQIEQNKWHHIALNFEPSKFLNIYIDGEKDSSFALAPDQIYDSTAHFSIGSIDPAGPAARWNAKQCRIDEVSIFKRALSDAEIKWLSNGKNFFGELLDEKSIKNNPTNKNVVAWWGMDNFYEKYLNSHSDDLVLNPRGNPSPVYWSGPGGNIGGGSFQLRNNEFNEADQIAGSGMSFKVDYNEKLALTGAQTWAAWIYPNSVGWDQNLGIDRYGIMSKYNWSTDNRSTLFALRETQFGNGEFYITTYISPTGGDYNSEWEFSTNTVGGYININKWTHIALVFEPSKRHEIYINGQLSAAKTTPAYKAWDNGLDLCIGAEITPINSNIFPRSLFHGNISNCCIFDKALTSGEMDWLYRNTYESLLGGEQVRLNSYYHCKEDHQSSFENAPNFTGIDSPWTQDFYWAPDNGLTNSVKFENEKHGFGYGIYNKVKNNNAVVPMSYNFSNISNKQLKSMLHFLENKNGYRRFKHQIPSVYNRPKVYYCDSWSHSMVYKDTNSLQVSFTEDPLGIIPDKD